MVPKHSWSHAKLWLTCHHLADTLYLRFSGDLEVPDIFISNLQALGKSELWLSSLEQDLGDMGDLSDSEEEHGRALKTDVLWRFNKCMSCELCQIKYTSCVFCFPREKLSIGCAIQLEDWGVCGWFSWDLRSTQYATGDLYWKHLSWEWFRGRG